MNAVVYRCYDRTDRVIYVGRTVQFGRRIAEHRHSASWWSEVARVERVEHESLDDAYAHEIAQIVEHRPPYNKLHNRRPVVPGHKRHMTSDLVGTKDAAQILGVSTRTVKRYALRGDELVPIAKMPGDKGAYVFHRAHVEAFAARRNATRAVA